MSNLLLLVHRIPFPPDKGDKIRSFNLLRHLSAKHNIYLGGFIDKKDDWQYVPNVEEYCSATFFRPIRSLHSKLSSAKSLVTGRSLSVGYYSNKELGRWVEELLNSRQIDIVVCFSSAMAQFLPHHMPNKTVVLADFVDLDSDKWRQYSSESKWPLSSIYTYEAKALGKWELDVLESVDAVTLVSSEECRLLMDRSEQYAKNVLVVRNGVDTEFFDPTIESDNPYSAGSPVAVFTGAMDYFANVQGVKWFVENAWPSIREHIPSAEFWIVGSNPTTEVLALDSADGVTVTGYVADIRPYLKHATIAIAPLQLARGVQNKVLESLAMGLPVIATPQALQGLDGQLPESITSASDASAFDDALSLALRSGASTSALQSRAYVLENYDWSQNLSAIDRILSDAIAAKTHRDSY